MPIADVPLVRDCTSMVTSVTSLATSVLATSPFGNASFEEVGWTTTRRSSSHVFVRLRRSGDERPVSVNVNGSGIVDAAMDGGDLLVDGGQPGVDRGVVDGGRHELVELGVPRLGAGLVDEHGAGAGGAEAGEVDPLDACGEVDPGRRREPDDLGLAAGEDHHDRSPTRRRRGAPSSCPASRWRSRRARRASSGLASCRTGPPARRCGAPRCRARCG